MQAFRVTGSAPFGSQRQNFSLDLAATSKDDAEHRCYSIIGSRHKANRRKIEINSVEEIDPRISTDAKIINTFREQIAAAGGSIAPSAEEE